MNSICRVNIVCLTALLLLTGCGDEDAADSGNAERDAAQAASSASNDGAEPAGSDSSVADRTPSPGATDADISSGERLSRNQGGVKSSSTRGRRTTEDGDGINELDSLFPQVVDAPEPKVVGTQPRSVKYSDSTIKARWQIKQFSDDSELNHGPYAEYWQNGQMFKEGVFEDGVPVGLWKYWHDNGQLSRELNYEKGQLDGSVEVFREDGTKEALRSYRSGLKDGKWHRYDDTGEKVISRFEYRGDLRHGKWTTSYPSGEPKVEEYYKENLLNGKRTLWYENGELAEEVSYRDGQRHGKMIAWNKDGTKKLEIEYQDGQPVTKESDSATGA